MAWWTGLGCVFEEVGEADVETAFAEADGGVEEGETAEADVELRDGGRAGAEVWYCSSKTGMSGDCTITRRLNMARCGN